MSMSIIPESAPFNEQQRAWLNGFFAGWLGLTDGESSSVQVALGSPTAAPEASEAGAPSSAEEYPWHDAALPIVDRMQLAGGRELKHQLMASMAQLDCGSCGYLCETYGAAIASGKETNLTLCSPGGKETRQAIKSLLKQRQSSPTNPSASPVAVISATAAKTAPVYSRKHPYPARLLESRRLNAAGSDKDTRHVVIDLHDSEITYEVGDAIGIFPTNCADLVHRIIGCLGVEPDTDVCNSQGQQRSLLDLLTEECCLREPSDELLEAVMAAAVDDQVRAAVAAMMEDGVVDGVDVLEVLEMCPQGSIDMERFVSTLTPLNPRLYSIASSQKVVGRQVHLTIGRVAFERGGRMRKGVASTMVADRLRPGEAVRIFPQTNHGGFTVPRDPQRGMIMVGPGTGIAPFMAFLQEREATAAGGPNWLFFGDQHESTDFLYCDQLQNHQRSGLLTRLSTAFSRDGAEKVYVQDRMREASAELWAWLDRGAHFYVCGDASQMAADVDRALHEIVASEGGLRNEDAAAYVREMIAQKRYVRDVY